MLVHLSLTLAAFFVLQPQDPGKSASVRCGPNCLYVALKACNVDGVSIQKVDKLLGPPGNWGYSMLALAKVAELSAPQHC